MCIGATLWVGRSCLMVIVFFPALQRLAGKVRSPSTAGLSNEAIGERRVPVAGVGLIDIFFFANVFPATIDKYNLNVIRFRKGRFFSSYHIRNFKNYYWMSIQFTPE